MQAEVEARPAPSGHAASWRHHGRTRPAGTELIRFPPLTGEQERIDQGRREARHAT